MLGMRAEHAGRVGVGGFGVLGLGLGPQAGSGVLVLGAESAGQDLGCGIWVLSPMVGPGVLGLGPGLGLQTGFGVLDLGADSTGRIWGAGGGCWMHRQGLGCWVHRQDPEEEEQGSDLLGSKSGE